MDLFVFTSEWSCYQHKVGSAHILTIGLEAAKSQSSLKAFKIEDYISSNSFSIRDSYLALIAKLAVSKATPTKVCHDLFSLTPKFSLWWSSLVAEKDNVVKSRLGTELILLIAINKFAIAHDITTITIQACSDQHLRLLSHLNHNIHIKRLQKSKYLISNSKTFSLRTMVRRILPTSATALIWLFEYMWTRRLLFSSNMYKIPKSLNYCLVFLSYLFHLDKQYIDRSIYRSAYWGNSLMDDSSTTGSLFIHHYVPSYGKPSAQVSYLARFNSNSVNNQYHVFLDSYMSASVLARTLVSWSKYLLRSYMLRMTIRSSSPLVQFFKSDLVDSLVGTTAMRNIINSYLFDAAFSSTSIQGPCVYLSEGLSWEVIATHYFKSHCGGKVAAYPHATVRFWDLKLFNYFTGMPILERRPYPDYILSNGSLVSNILQYYQNPKTSFRPVEALRYNSILEKNTVEPCDSYPSLQKHFLKILLLGDADKAKTDFMMQSVRESIDHLDLDVDVDVEFKPHPLYIVSEEFLVQLGFKSINNQLLSLDHRNYICAITGDFTSASIDTICLGFNTIVFCSDEPLNLSPLFGSTDAIFASSSTELSEAVLHCISLEKSFNSFNQFFNIDDSLSQWKSAIHELKSID